MSELAVMRGQLVDRLSAAGWREVQTGEASSWWAAPDESVKLVVPRNPDRRALLNAAEILVGWQTRTGERLS